MYQKMTHTLEDLKKLAAMELRDVNREELVDIAVRRSWDVWSGIPVHLQVFWQMSAIVVMYWQERPLHRTF